jgi:hypothetical protein
VSQQFGLKTEFKTKLMFFAQITVTATMNTIKFDFVPACCFGELINVSAGRQFSVSKAQQYTAEPLATDSNTKNYDNF